MTPEQKRTLAALKGLTQSPKDIKAIINSLTGHLEKAVEAAVKKKNNKK